MCPKDAKLERRNIVSMKLNVLFWTHFNVSGHWWWSNSCFSRGTRCSFVPHTLTVAASSMPWNPARSDKILFPWGSTSYTICEYQLCDQLSYFQKIESSQTKQKEFTKQYVLCLVTQSCPTLCNPMDCSPPGSSVHGDSPGKNTRVGCHALLQGIFPTQGLNPGLPHYSRILYHLSHQGSSN